MNRHKVSEIQKNIIEALGKKLIHGPFVQYINPSNQHESNNYLTELSSKWYRNYFYLISHYQSDNPNAISPSFEVRYTRIQCTGEATYSLSYMRHNGQWNEVYTNLSVSKLERTIISETLFHP